MESEVEKLAGELKDISKLSPEDIENGREYYKVAGSVGIYKRSDGTYYGI